MKTAILYCIFNRPDVVKETFEPIRKAKPPRLYIASDGARVDKEGEEEIVNRTRKYVLDNIDWDCQVFTLFQEKNIGCDTAIPTAVEWFFKHEEMGIILEDDILASQEFFKFCEILLEKYKDDPRVRNISGFCISRNFEYDSDYIFCQRPYTWGWAAWRRSWEGFDIKISDWAKLRKTKWLKNIFKNNKYQVLYWMEMFNYFYNNSPWDFAYTFSNFKLVPMGCYSIVPANKNLVTNIGYNGVHFNESTSHSVLGWQIDKIDINNLRHPYHVSLDYAFLDKSYSMQLSDMLKDYKPPTMARFILNNVIWFFKCFVLSIKCFISFFTKNRSTLKRREKNLYNLNLIHYKENLYFWHKLKNRTN